GSRTSRRQAAHSSSFSREKRCLRLQSSSSGPADRTPNNASHARELSGEPMSLSRFLLVVGCLSALLLHGCGKSGSDNANVRALNLISGTSGISVTAGGVTILSNGTFESLSGFSSVGSGNQEFKVNIPGGVAPIIDTVYTLSGTVDYSYITTGTAGAAAAVLIADPFGSPGSNVAFRVLNMSLV